MASWHLFKQSAAQTWLLRRAGAFSVYREGMDRDALKVREGDSGRGQASVGALSGRGDLQDKTIM